MMGIRKQGMRRSATNSGDESDPENIYDRGFPPSQLAFMHQANAAKVDWKKAAERMAYLNSV
jgi:hypothetical protein